MYTYSSKWYPYSFFDHTGHIYAGHDMGDAMYPDTPMGLDDGLDHFDHMLMSETGGHSGVNVGHVVSVYVTIVSPS